MKNAYYNDKHFTLLHNDIFSALKEVKDNSVDMIFADPPYRLSNDGFTVHAGKQVSVNKGKWDKSEGIEEDFEFHKKWISACRRVLKDHGTIWISGTYHSIYACGHALSLEGYKILNDIAWFKPNASPNLSVEAIKNEESKYEWSANQKWKEIFGSRFKG